ncbi:hypothetical protein V8G57_26115 [Collimonas sp. H4R21]|uniref:Immunity protein 52 of polymorphic toxin system n=1 Tax=Collimonas rhizosphaerae TaxID=3126357 RepID=A0ABU9Q3L8_9BURK
MNISFTFTVKEESLSVEEGHERLTQLLAAIRPFLPIPEWYVTPGKKGRLVAVSDSVQFLARARHDLAEHIRAWSAIGILPEYPFGFEVTLTSAMDEKAYDTEEGICTLRFKPGGGRIQLHIRTPDLAWPSRLTERMKSILNAVLHLNPASIEFASLDVEQLPRKDGERGTDQYSFDFSPFPYPRFLGWMGFVPKVLKPQDIPEAAEVISLPNCHGSIVIAVGDIFDLRNPQHIKQAQQVEMRLAALDALPEIERNLKMT